MFIRRIKLFKLLGFELRMDLSWLFLAVLITWTLAQGVFKNFYPDLSERTYWLMGVAGCLTLFLSILFHEFSHALVARAYNMPVHGITLFVFGGVAEMQEEPTSAAVEFQMALAGPVSSFVLAMLMYLLSAVGVRLMWPTAMLRVIDYTAYLNVVLGLFNLVPAFPLDGGRLLRSAVWYKKKDFYKATQISGTIGGMFGIVLMIVGVLWILEGSLISGIWWFLIGMFLRQAAHMMIERTEIRRTLEGERVSRFMSHKPVVVPMGTSLDKFVKDYVYQHHHKMFPLVRDDRIEGCITVDRLKTMPRSDWPRRTVDELAVPCVEQTSVSPDEDAIAALSKMNISGQRRLPVIENGQLIGILSLKDMMDFFSLKMDLESI